MLIRSFPESFVFELISGVVPPPLSILITIFFVTDTIMPKLHLPDFDLEKFKEYNHNNSLHSHVLLACSCILAWGGEDTNIHYIILTVPDRDTIVVLSDASKLM